MNYYSSDSYEPHLWVEFVVPNELITRTLRQKLISKPKPKARFIIGVHFYTVRSERREAFFINIKCNGISKGRYTTGHYNGTSGLDTNLQTFLSPASTYRTTVRVPRFRQALEPALPE